MPSAIGLRTYIIKARRKGNKEELLLRDEGLLRKVPEFIEEFTKLKDAIVDKDAERSWFFERRKISGEGSIKGYLRYGTYGFESYFRDAVTRKRNYHRQTNDVEEIPLFFEFWCPPDSKNGFAVFQSFQGRSCIHLVAKAMKDRFELENPEFTIDFSKVMPVDAKKGIYHDAPVKKLHLLRRGAPADRSDGYYGNEDPQNVNFEVVISARRKRNLGPLDVFLGSLPTGGSGAVIFEGIEFDEASAEIQVGTKTKKVNVMGISSEAGVIDITHKIKKGRDGHPTFNSVSAESDEILEHVFKIIGKWPKK